MIVLEFEGVETDYCAQCGGVWLDKGEMGLILKQSLDVDALPAGEGKKGNRRCPHCARRMRVVKMPGMEVEVDLCPREHGIWLDKGELKAIIQQGAGRADWSELARYCDSVFG